MFLHWLIESIWISGTSHSFRRVFSLTSAGEEDSVSGPFWSVSLTSSFFSPLESNSLSSSGSGALLQTLFFVL